MKKYVKQQTFLVWVCFATTLGWGSLANAGSTEQKIKINPSIKKDLCQLKIDKKHTPDNFIYGDTGQYNIEITNPNKFSCSHIIIKDTLPENMTFISSSSPWSCTADSFNPQKVTCTLNSLAGSTSSVLSFKVNVPDEVNAKGKGWLKNEAKNCASVIANRSGPVSASISIIARKKPLRRSTSCDTVSVIPKDNKEFCEADVMMVIDKSNSMNGTLLQNEKNAAIFFANKAFSFPDNQVGVVSFHAFPTLDQPLTTNKPLVISAINRLRASGVTHIHRGLRKGLDEILANSVTPQRIVILLTDGRNVRAITDGMVRLDAINASNDGIIIYTIGYGNNINEDLLRFVASKTHGQYYSAPQNSQLEGIFDQISQDICTQKTNISGIKFHDMNGDGVQNTGEGPIENIQISLDSADSNGNSTGIAGITNTAADGSYSFSGIAPGTYIVRENIAALPGWTQTFPTANNGVYFVTLTEGQQINHLNFGNANCGNLCDATVSGIKYYDTNHNGIYDAGETKLSGWLIEMIHSDGSFSFDVTDSNGDYSINIPHTMLAETVTLSEWMQPFWVAVAPVAGTYPSIPVTTGDQL
ncbi:MAG: VWA domain-containing protein, partial [Methylococcales bacterium]|nr:VWA domain-containing protein [Methylococcales bacterium]